MDFVDLGLKFTSAPAKRTKTRAIVLHHFASEASVQAIHNNAIRNDGWIGIGYNVCVMLDGSVVLGRGIDTVGAHAGRTQPGSPDYAGATWNNRETVGVGVQGYYHPGHKLSRMVMPDKQYRATVDLCRWLMARYPGAEILPHRGMPATATVCPGSYFPFDAIVKEAMGGASGGTVHPAPFAVTRYLRRLTPMQRGEDVGWLQERLNASGLAGARVVVDKIFGDKTLAALKLYQRGMRLSPDGVAGPLTVAAMGGKWAR